MKIKDDFEIASSLLLRKAVSAGKKSGIVYLTMENLGTWKKEAMLRHRFGSLATDWSTKNQYSRLKELNGFYNNGFYNTRYPLADLETLLACLNESLAEKNLRTDLIEGEVDLMTHSQYQVLGSIVESTLEKLRNKKKRRGYSLLAKFLHFAFPKTFVPFDSQATASIVMFAKFANHCRQITDDDRDHIQANEISFKNGSGYKHLLGFYKAVWEHTENAIHEQIKFTASQIQEKMRNKGASLARFTTLSLLDKFLWKASGDPIVLGLANPLCEKEMVQANDNSLDDPKKAPFRQGLLDGS